MHYKGSNSECSFGITVDNNANFIYVIIQNLPIM